eukprot:evm.model.NODE_16513_length_4637_cov_29.981453.1
MDASDEEEDAKETEYSKAMELANILFEVTDEEEEEGEGMEAFTDEPKKAVDLVEHVAIMIQAGEASLWAGSEAEDVHPAHGQGE